MKNGIATLEESLALSHKTESSDIIQLYELKTYVHIKPCTQGFRATLFIIAKIGSN